VNVTAGRAVYKNAERPKASGWGAATLLREIIAKHVKARGGRGRDLTRRTLYLPALIVAAVLMACAVVLALSEKAEATFPGKDGRIVYAGWNRGEGLKGFEIYTINPDGSGKRQLTHNNTGDFSPAYSPDGKKIVYVGKDGPKGDLEIYTINARGGDKFQVTNNDVDEEDPAYSPSGKRIAYTDLTVNEPGPNIYSVKAGGGGKRLVARNGFTPSYSPDGKRIAYACWGETFRIVDTDICTISVRRDDKLAQLIPEKLVGNALHDVLHHKVLVTNNDTDDQNPDYSPNGNRIVYEGLEGRWGKKQDQDASTNIYTIKAGGGGNLNLTKSPKNASIWNALPSYSPDGEKIAYVYVPDGEIYTINAGGGGKSRVTNDDAYPYGLSWGTRP
jgi:Tol biopolymer transport system component